MAPQDETALDYLKSIDATLKQLLTLAQARATKGRSVSPKSVASDRDLDGKYGNPAVRFNPRDWTGPSFKNQPMSQCDPEFLDMLADTFEYFAGKAEETNERTESGKSVADFKRLDAARARGWAKRIRAGTHTASSATAWANGNGHGNDVDNW